MQLEDFFDFNTEPVEHIRIRGTRIDIDHVIELYRMKMTPEQIAVHFGSPITVEQAYATITYYLLNKESVDAYLARGEVIARQNYEAYRSQHPSPVAERLRALKKKFKDENGDIDFVALQAYLAKERKTEGILV